MAEYRSGSHTVYDIKYHFVLKDLLFFFSNVISFAFRLKKATGSSYLWLSSSKYPKLSIVLVLLCFVTLS